MNERIEKETIRLWREDYAGIFNNDGYNFACIQQIAQHFYKLALEDVKKKVENRLNDLNPIKGWFGDRPLRDVNPKTFPRESELEKIIELIEKLSK